MNYRIYAYKDTFPPINSGSNGVIHLRLRDYRFLAQVKAENLADVLKITHHSGWEQLPSVDRAHSSDEPLRPLQDHDVIEEGLGGPVYYFYRGTIYNATFR